MEEDIKILENYKRFVLDKTPEHTTSVTNFEVRKALENLIKGYRELYKKYDDLLVDVYDLFIPKSKIKKKMEELFKKLDEPNNDRFEKDDDVYYNKIKAQIRILKELTEDK